MQSKCQNNLKMFKNLHFIQIIDIDVIVFIPFQPEIFIIFIPYKYKNQFRYIFLQCKRVNKAL